MSIIYSPQHNELRRDGLDRIKRHGWTVSDAPGVFREVPKGDLVIDRTYQRAADGETKITRMAGAWSWLACGALIVADRGEALAAAGKTQRWGRYSVNPELPEGEQETNENWLLRELEDLSGAIIRLRAAHRAGDK